MEKIKVTITLVKFVKKPFGSDVSIEKTYDIFLTESEATMSLLSKKITIDNVLYCIEDSSFDVLDKKLELIVKLLGTDKNIVKLFVNKYDDLD